MVITVHQPMFLQYLGFYRKVLKSDVLVVYDTAQYSKNDWHNRNRIKTANGVVWLTVPVSYHLGDSFQAAKPSNVAFTQSHMGIIEAAYSNTPHFKEVFPVLKEAYKRPFNSLAELNCNLQNICLKMLDVKPKIVLSSTLDLHGRKATEALVEICQYLGADTYLAGMGAGYMDMDLFNNAAITVKYNDFVATSYPQQWGKFAPNLSVIDALFNVGREEARKLISY